MNLNFDSNSNYKNLNPSLDFNLNLVFNPKFETMLIIGPERSNQIQVQIQVAVKLKVKAKATTAALAMALALTSTLPLTNLSRTLYGFLNFEFENFHRIFVPLENQTCIR